MRKVCMCDYCNFINTEETVIEHEKTCKYNPNYHSCVNCKYAFKELTVSFDLFKPYEGEELVCKYKQYQQGLSGTISCISDKLPVEKVCEHWEFGEPGEVHPI